MHSILSARVNQFMQLASYVIRGSIIVDVVCVLNFDQGEETEGLGNQSKLK